LGLSQAALIIGKCSETEDLTRARGSRCPKRRGKQNIASLGCLILYRTSVTLISSRDRGAVTRGRCTLASETDDACRMREWRARRRRERRAACPSCGGIFIPGRRDAQYCSLPCKQHGYRVRKAAPGGPQIAAAGLLRRPGSDSGTTAPEAPARPQEPARPRFDVMALIG
jgi:hypothetical protein